jgi:hypothetical protein
MSTAEILYYALTMLVVVGMVWRSTYSKKLQRLLVEIPIVALLVIVLSNIVLSPETIRNELYWYWDLPSFLIKSVSSAIFIIILTLGSVLISWGICVRWNKPKWLGVFGGLATATVLCVPAEMVSLLVACASGDCL